MLNHQRKYICRDQAIALQKKLKGNIPIFSNWSDGSRILDKIERYKLLNIGIIYIRMYVNPKQVKMILLPKTTYAEGNIR